MKKCIPLIAGLLIIFMFSSCTKNDNEGKPQLELFKNLGCNIKLINEKSDDDTTGNIGRKTYIISS